ncbi:MAG TPA: hypothetical protein VHV31_13565 [Nitrolancea sp.]|nr:hypothetical protein [Nitrolancea sp.]
MTLALHLGLGLTVDTLAEAMTLPPVQLGTELYQARSSLAEDLRPGCAEFRASLARYRDRSLDINGRATLLQHVQQCEACRKVLERFQTLDAQLLEQIDLEAAALPPLKTRRARQSRDRFIRPLTLVAAIVLVVAISLSVFAAISRLSNRNSRVTTSQPLSGWLLTSDNNGTLTATDLANGDQQPVGTPGSNASVTSNGVADIELSPDHTRIARLQSLSIPRPMQQELEIDTLDGKQLKSFTFASSYGQIVAWDGNDTVLVASHPESESTDNEDAYIARIERDSTIISFNVSNGDQHQIFKGSVSQAYLSPDGTMIVLQTVFALTLDQPLSFEVRPIHGLTVGAPLVTVNNGGLVDPIWAPDSSHVYLGVNRDEVPGTPESRATPATTPVSTAEHVATISVDRDGSIIQLPNPPGSYSDAPVDISPDGQRLLHQTIVTQGQSPGAQLWESSPTGSDLHQITMSSPGQFTRGVWSPDGAMAIEVQSQPFFLHPTAETNSLGDVPATSFIVVDRSGASFAAFSRIDSSGTSVIGWLPPNAFTNLSVRETPSRLSDPKPADVQPPNLVIDPDDQPSPNSKYIVVTNPSTLQPIIWSQAVTLGRGLPAGVHDLSWFADSSALIGVGDAPGNQTSGANQINTFAPAFNVSLPPYDFRAYDPAGIGTSRTSQYATPLISPNENELVFFVVNGNDHSITLWLAGFGITPKVVTHWVLPDNNQLPGGPIAAWIDNDRLLFAEPSDWHGGLPRQIELNTLTVSHDGVTNIDTVATLRTHGTEQGIALEELAVNQASGRIAYRLRHFAKASVTSGVIDTIEITSADKIADAIEVSRDAPASGIGWSPDGETLAAVVPHEIDFVSGTGTIVSRLTGLSQPSDPRWIKPTEVWFGDNNGDGERIMTVQLH